MLLWDSWKILYTTRNAWNDIHKSMTMQKILHNYVFVRRTLIGSGMKPDNPPSNSLYMSANRAHNQPRRDSVYFCHIYWRSECRRYRSSIFIINLRILPLSPAWNHRQIRHTYKLYIIRDLMLEWNRGTLGSLVRNDVEAERKQVVERCDFRIDSIVGLLAFRYSTG